MIIIIILNRLLFTLAGNLVRRPQQPQEQCYPFLTVCGTQLIAVFNVRTDVDACDCTRDFTERTPERESALKTDFTVRTPKADLIVRTPEETALKADFTVRKPEETLH